MSLFEIQMKPTGIAKRNARKCPEYLTTIEANSKEEAVNTARISAETEGFKWYAITKVKELTQ
jgi:hypothetical protein